MASLIETVDLDTAEELLRELLPVTSRLWAAFRNGGERPYWIFRGQREASWDLQASALRGIDVPSIDALVAPSVAYIEEHERPAIFKFTLPANQALPVLRLLEEHHVHAGSIFPGLAGVVKAMKESARHR